MWKVSHELILVFWWVAKRETGTKGNARPILEEQTGLNVSVYHHVLRLASGNVYACVSI